MEKETRRLPHQNKAPDLSSARQAQLHFFDWADIWGCILFKGHDTWRRTRNAVWLKATSPFPLRVVLNTENTHVARWTFSPGLHSFKLHPLGFEMQKKPPPKTTLWFVSLRQWSCMLAARPGGGGRVFGQSADPSLIYHCCAHFIDFPVGCTGQFLTSRCDVSSYKSLMSVRAPARWRLGFQKEFVSVKLLR